MKKKSFAGTLKSTKKANLVAAPAKNEGTSTRKTVCKGIEGESQNP